MKVCGVWTEAGGVRETGVEIDELTNTRLDLMERDGLIKRGMVGYLEKGVKLGMMDVSHEQWLYQRVVL